MKYGSSQQMESNFFREKTNFLVANDIARESNNKQNIIKSNRWKYQNKNLHG